MNVKTGASDSCLLLGGFLFVHVCSSHGASCPAQLSKASHALVKAVSVYDELLTPLKQHMREASQTCKTKPPQQGAGGHWVRGPPSPLLRLEFEEVHH